MKRLGPELDPVKARGVLLSLRLGFFPAFIGIVIPDSHGNQAFQCSTMKGNNGLRPVRHRSMQAWNP